MGRRTSLGWGIHLDLHFWDSSLWSTWYFQRHGKRQFPKLEQGVLKWFRTLTNFWMALQKYSYFLATYHFSPLLVLTEWNCKNWSCLCLCFQPWLSEISWHDWGDECPIYGWDWSQPPQRRPILSGKIVKRLRDCSSRMDSHQD